MKLYLDKDWLYDQRYALNKTARTIAKECGVHYTTIDRTINKLDIREKVIPIYTDELWLRNEYSKKSTVQIAEEQGVDTATILYQMKKNGIETRSISEAQMGERNVMWNNGSSFGLYGMDFNRKLREKIRRRDNYTCQECPKHQKDLTRKLAVHHIDYDKTNHNENNLISLCNSCHAQTNYNRNDWIEYYRNKLEC